MDHLLWLTDMAWVILFIAGVLESCWAVGMRYTEGFTRLVPSLWVGAAMALSMYLLSVAVKTIPVGTGYAVWVGIGIIGAALGERIFLKSSFSVGQVIFLVLLIISVIGLKLTTPAFPK